MKRLWMVVCSAALVTALFVLGCSSGSKTACAAGGSVACACANGNMGAQVCKSDGSGYEACSCAGAGSGSSSGSGSSGTMASGASSGTTSSVTASQAASDAAAAFCAQLNSCSSLFVSLVYGSVATCNTRLGITFSMALAGPGTGWTPALAETCAKAIPGAACQDLLGNILPSACLAPAGQYPNGAACGDDSQCMSQYCNSVHGQCGACAAAPVPGGNCMSDSQCPNGTVCSGMAGAMQCVTPGVGGTSCSNIQPCKATLVCKNSVCAPPDMVGSMCTPGNTVFGSCDEYQGSYCNGTVCAALSMGGPGQPCNPSAGAFCNASGLCSNGACLSAAADGQTCNATTGPRCMPPAVCANSVCVILNPANCH